MTVAQTYFRSRAVDGMRALIARYGLAVEDAAAIFGNLGYESGGFKSLQEKKPVVAGSKGGYGWGQWTGPRRNAFMAWCAAKGLPPSSDEANLGYLCHELDTTEAKAIPAVKRAKSLRDKVVAFELAFERAGVKAYAKRLTWAQMALEAFHAAQGTSAAPSENNAPAANGEARVDTGPMSGKYNPVTEGVQRSLAQMGYQPGFYDGKWGGATRGAIAAFQNDRHMAGTLPVIDDALVAEIAKAKQEGFTRPIAKDRSDATSDDLKDALPEVGAAKKAGFWAKVQGWWSAVFGGVTATGVASNLIDAKSNVDTVHGWFGDNAGWIVGAGCAAAVVVIAIVLAKKTAGAASEAAEASTEAFNTGARK